MTVQDVKTMLLQALPDVLEHDSQVRERIWQLVTPYFAPRQETDNRFDRMMDELRQMREESERKWAENQAELRQMREESERKWDEQRRTWAENQAELRQMREESERKWAENQAELRQMREESERKWDEQRRTWDEQRRKWDENQATINQMLAQMNRLDTKITTKIGAIGARWGRSSEGAFRNALRGILEETFAVQVVHVNEFDDEGLVFGYPEFVELDLVIRNGMLLICEIKSSVSHADVYAFERKVRFYERRHQQHASQMIIISPMIDTRAMRALERLGMRAYNDADDVELDAGDAETG